MRRLLSASLILLVPFSAVGQSCPYEAFQEPGESAQQNVAGTTGPPARLRLTRMRAQTSRPPPRLTRICCNLRSSPLWWRSRKKARQP